MSRIFRIERKAFKRAMDRKTKFRNPIGLYAPEILDDGEMSESSFRQVKIFIRKNTMKVFTYFGEEWGLFVGDFVAWSNSGILASTGIYRNIKKMKEEVPATVFIKPEQKKLELHRFDNDTLSLTYDDAFLEPRD